MKKGAEICIRKGMPGLKKVLYNPSRVWSMHGYVKEIAPDGVKWAKKTLFKTTAIWERDCLQLH